MEDINRRNFAIGGLTVLAAALVSGCSRRAAEEFGKGVWHGAFLSPTDAIVRASYAAVRTTAFYRVAYENAARATRVRDRTVEDAIRRHRAASGGGLVEQLETSNDLIIALSDGKLAKEIQAAAQDPDFRKSWSEVEPYFNRAAESFVVADSLQGYTSGLVTSGWAKQILKVKEELDRKGNLGSKLATFGITVEFLAYAVTVVPTMISNFDSLGELDENLQEIPNYARQREAMEEAGSALSQQQRDTLSNITAEQVVESGGNVFGDPFASGAGATGGVAAPGDSRNLDARLRDAAYCKTVQGVLKERGFYTGRVDGICGRGTRSAIRRFKSTEPGLPNDSTYDSATQRALLGGG